MLAETHNTTTTTPIPATNYSHIVTCTCPWQGRYKTSQAAAIGAAAHVSAYNARMLAANGH